MPSVTFLYDPAKHKEHKAVVAPRHWAGEGLRRIFYPARPLSRHLFPFPAMNAHRVAATVSDDGSLTVYDVPFRKGEAVEVIVLPRPPSAHEPAAASLRGSVQHYDRPFDPATDLDDWGAAEGDR